MLYKKSPTPFFILHSSFFIPFLFLLSTVIISCSPPPIDLEFPQHQPKLVVSSQIIPDRTMFVSLTRSFSALSNVSSEDNNLNSDFVNKLLVQNAFVTISYFGKTDTLGMIAPGVYASAKTLQYDYGTYTLYARDPATGQEITAVTSINPLVKFDSLNVKINKQLTDTEVFIGYTFHDVPGINNWYVINYYVKQDSLAGANLDIANYFESGSNKLNEFELLSDKIFENGVYTGSRKLHNVNTNDSIAVTLSNISEGYFKFLHTYLNSGNVINQISGEPVNYPTNVNNGFGYFSAHHPDIRVVYLDKK